ncbi:uncharacterized protein LOC120335881 [Styela clava]|uniref:protein ras-2-like n=1 Tax=Styela clava TaxID=7725 RepID=UPI00193A2814|nr:protein ras-2-like [Styela clava]
MNAPVLRRLKKSSSTVGSVPTFRIVVFGQSGVGKTAMSVRFVTKRFIGEYDPTLENIYQHYVVVGGTPVLFEIMDTAGQEENELMMEEKIRWADAFILVYAINDQTSFEELPRFKVTITHTIAQMSHQHKQVQPEPVITIVGNKTDLEPDRMVDRLRGEGLANSLRGDFREISVRDGLNDVISVFEDTYEFYKTRMAVFHSLNDSNGSLRKKGKSFKYVDRIPRMQGKRRNYSYNDLLPRHHVINDVISDIMTSKIDEDEISDNFPSSGNNSRFFHRSTASLPTDVIASNPENGRPPMRSRRNAVVGLTNGIHLNSDTQSSDSDQDRRRQKLIKSSHLSDDSLNDRHRSSVTRARTLRIYDSNNNSEMGANRRCRSQEHIDLNRSNSMVETFTKRAISFDISNRLSKRV